MPYLPGLQSFQHGRAKGTKKPVKRQRSMARSVPTTTPAFKKAVRSQVLRLSETKVASYFSPARSIRNITVDSAAFQGTVEACFPQAGTLPIPQGDGQGERIGNRILLRSLVLDLFLYPVAYNATTNDSPQPAYVKLWIGYQRNQPTSPPLITSSRMVQNGNGSGALTGLLRDMYVDLNDEFVKVVYQRVFKIGNASYEGSGEEVSNQSWSNNDFQLGGHLRLDLAKYLPKNIIYDDVLGTPTSRGLYFWLEFVDVDNTTPTNITGHSYQYSLQMKYKDP